MKVHWHAITALILAIGVIIVLSKLGTPIRHFLARVREIGPGHSAEDQLLGLIALAVIGVSIVALVKVLTQRRGQ